MRCLLIWLSITVAIFASVDQAGAAGDLTRQDPIEVRVELGRPGGQHGFFPSVLEFETGRLYKLVLANTSDHPHYFTSERFAQSVFTRKAQVTQRVGDKIIVLAEFKGAIREIEVYPGQTAEWWLVPVAAGRFDDLRCDIVDSDGKSHTAKGMVGSIVIK
jgi:uncharacterized cupredoxin-like copper-binding protein